MINYLKEYIQKNPFGKITFADYIMQALYHPQYGYYMNDKRKIGREGDFITTSNISDIYGRSIAKWFYRKATELDLPFSICEIGAGTGRFAKAFIDEWKMISAKPIQYFILEESPYHRKLQQEELIFDENIKQIASLEEISPFDGLIFSNELFDAFPVHVIENQAGQLQEVMISVKDDLLVESLEPLNNEEIKSFLERSGLKLNNQQRIEIPLQMESMIISMSKTIQRGLVLTVDYGYTNEEWLEPARRNGSLRGYFKHQQINNILERPGEMDITSHIHIDAFIKIGNQLGLKHENTWRQDEFLLAAGILEELQENYDPNPFSDISKRNRAIRSLIIPGGISSSFHVILQQKGV
ncbi:class I SAM-dependent methyltransferase [Cytobacillus massiliigabonensis]|uniref:class I SAM-dependent methyltransferase n=1 Tax=Cytobacillus massiliigabonensis TaxID=1871011 RepID=UPI000C857B90|nr:SAM-dependent methyltransferase [Cytobacillus massiliigabonensis]